MLRVTTIVCAPLLLTVVGYCSSFTDIVVYGDSLSDNGNVYARTGNTIPASPPYFNGRFSNGPIAVEDLAAYYNVPLIDNAYGGATTGVGDSGDGGSVTTLGLGLPGMTTQFQSTKSLITPVAPASLFVVWGGPDDLSAPAPGDAGNPVAIAHRAASDIVAIVNGIESIGGKQILVPGITDLALVPAYASNTAAADTFATTFNQDLISELPPGAIYVDTYNLLKNLVQNPSQYGFTNATSACLTTTSLCANPNQYVFFDSQHPSAAAQALLARQFESAIPEPGTALLGVSALGALMLCRRYVRARV